MKLDSRGREVTLELTLDYDAASIQFNFIYIITSHHFLLGQVSMVICLEHISLDQASVLYEIIRWLFDQSEERITFFELYCSLWSGTCYLNVDKTKELAIDRRKRTPVEPITIQGSEMEIIDCYKYLGVHVNSRLDCKDLL